MKFFSGPELRQLVLDADQVMLYISLVLLLSEDGAVDSFCPTPRRYVKHELGLSACSVDAGVARAHTATADL